MTPEQYQRHVLALLRATYPDETFDATPDPLVITYGEAQIGLQNLYTVYANQALEPDDRDTHIREHFWNLLATLSAEQNATTLSWEEARERIRVQFMRVENAGVAPVITYPFTDEVVIALVIDLPQAYSFVREPDRERWDVTEELLYEQGITNLESGSTGVEIHGSEGPDRLLAIQTMDGYDAARLLLPAIRKLAVDRLGEPCLAAIPNRDFIILWSRSNSREFHGFVRDKVRQDFESRPYPLTSDVFVVTEAGVKTEANA